MKLLFLLLLLASFATAHTIVLTLDAPDTGLSGLAWGNNNLWTLSANTRQIRQINPTNGAVISTFYFNYTESANPTGLAYNANYNRVLAGCWAGTTGYVYQYTSAGAYVTKTSMCGG